MLSQLRSLLWAAMVLVLAVGTARVPAALAAWVDSAKATSTFTAAPDWLAPLVSGSVIAKTTGYLAGSVKQGGTYYVYANVSDSGNPASGVSAERADVTTVTPAGSAVTLVAGAYSVGGVTYTHRSGALTATTPLANGTRPYSISSVDVAGNTRTQTGYTVMVDNVEPTAVDIQTANNPAGVHGRADAGDTVRFTHSDRIDPESILAGWSGVPVNVVVRLIDGGCALVVLATVCAADTLAVYDATNTNQLPLGTVNLGEGDYYGTALGTAPPLTFGASGTASKMEQSGASVTITLGTPSATPGEAAAPGAMVWTPSASAYDAAGNHALTTPATEVGLADREF